MPEIPWMRRWEEAPEQVEGKKREIANMEAEDYAVLLEEIEHR